MVIFVIKIISSYTYQFGPRQVRNLKQCSGAQRQRSLYVDFSSYDYGTGTTIWRVGDALLVPSHTVAKNFKIYSKFEKDTKTFVVGPCSQISKIKNRIFYTHFNKLNFRGILNCFYLTKTCFYSQFQDKKFQDISVLS